MPGSPGRPDGGGGAPGAAAGGDPSPGPLPAGAEEAALAPDDAAAVLRLALDQLSGLGLGGAGCQDEEGTAADGGPAAGAADGGAAAESAPLDGPEAGVPLPPPPEPDVSPPPPPPPPRPPPPEVFAGFAPHPAALGPPTLLAEQMNMVGSRRKSVNMTECVPVPSSEHVAEIVGRQGEWLPSGVPLAPGGVSLAGPDTPRVGSGPRPPWPPLRLCPATAAGESWAQPAPLRSRSGPPLPLSARLRPGKAPACSAPAWAVGCGLWATGGGIPGQGTGRGGALHTLNMLGRGSLGFRGGWGGSRQGQEGSLAHREVTRLDLPAWGSRGAWEARRRRQGPYPLSTLSGAWAHT